MRKVKATAKDQLNQNKQIKSKELLIKLRQRCDFIEIFNNLTFDFLKTPFFKYRDNSVTFWSKLYANDVFFRIDYSVGPLYF